MSNIGSAPGIGSGPTEVAAVRPLGADLNSAPAAAAVPAAATAIAQSAPLVTTTAPDAGSPPIDSERVATIRQAIATNSYPVIPTKIGDAMIAAGMLLRTPK